MGGSRGETASGNPREQYYHLVPKRIAIVNFSGSGRVFPYNFRIEGFTRYGTTVRTSTFGFWGFGRGFAWFSGGNHCYVRAFGGTDVPLHPNRK